MWFLDMDEALITLAEKVDLVYSPLVDVKTFPDDVDITLVEGAVSSEEDLHKIVTIRGRTKTLVSLGDCAVTANLPGMRNLSARKLSVTGPTARMRHWMRARPSATSPSCWTGCGPCMRLYTWISSFPVARRRPTPFPML